MAADIPTSEPTEIIIGETVKWRTALTNYSPADGWALKYYLRGAGAGLNLTQADAITAGTSDWLITIPATAAGNPLPPATDQIVAGDYVWESWVESGSEKYRIDSGKIVVKQSLSAIGTDTAYDGRSPVKVTLDAIRAAIAGRATTAQQERAIGNTTIRFMTIPDLIVAETRFQQLYNQEVRSERMKRGAPFIKNVHTRFMPPQ